MASSIRENFEADEEAQRLVISLAREKYNSLQARFGNLSQDYSLNKLVQAGHMGLAKAAKQYKPEKGVKFSVFAYKPIQFAIIDYLRESDYLTIRQRQQVKELEAVEKRLNQRLGGEPSPRELAKALGWSEKKVEEVDRFRAPTLRLDTDEEEDKPTVIDVPGSGAAEGEFMKMVLADDTDDCLEHALKHEERAVLMLRYFEDELTHDVVGKILGIPRSTVARIEKRAKVKLRHCMESKGWGPEDF